MTPNLLGSLDAGTNGWQTLHVVLTSVYLAALGIACVYGVHRYWLVLLERYYHRRQTPEPDQFKVLPRVTVQLPLYNEATVAERIIEAACRLDYPRDRLQIQVLDDSTDECAAIARRCVERLRQAGHDVICLHRDHRTGFKAGALQEGQSRATGRFIAVFDADFIPPPDFLHRAIHYFTQPRVGMVQAAWGHLNREVSTLTRCQAVFLDSHFHIDHTARHRAGHWFNFNSTAGIWRRQAIDTAGGWQHDTLTEDMDLSYRAQLAGWRFIYLPALCCPAELPADVPAFKSQQHRWIKGTMQTAAKLLPRILRADVSPGHKIEAWFHLTSPVVHPCVVLIVLLAYPAMAMNLTPFAGHSIASGLFGWLVLLMATMSGGTYYLAGQRVQGRSWAATLWQLPMLMALGVGMSVNNTRAMFEAIIGHRSPFVRTPKAGESRIAERDRNGPRWSAATWTTVLEWMMGAYALVCMAMSLRAGPQRWGSPFLLLFAAGFFYVAAGSTPWRWITKIGTSRATSPSA